MSPHALHKDTKKSIKFGFPVWLKYSTNIIYLDSAIYCYTNQIIILFEVTIIYSCIKIAGNWDLGFFCSRSKVYLLIDRIGRSTSSIPAILHFNIICGRDIYLCEIKLLLLSTNWTRFFFLIWPPSCTAARDLSWNIQQSCVTIENRTTMMAVTRHVTVEITFDIGETSSVCACANLTSVLTVHMWYGSVLGTKSSPSGLSDVQPWSHVQNPVTVFTMPWWQWTLVTMGRSGTVNRVFSTTDRVSCFTSDSPIGSLKSLHWLMLGT